MKAVLASLSKQIIIEQLNCELASHQTKLEYHKKISSQYEELIIKTRQKIEHLIASNGGNAQ